MNNFLTISQLGKLVGLSTKTIRFYEEIDLIEPAQRAENGYRMYESSIIEDLKLIKYARDLGIPIEKIRKLMKGCSDSCEHTKGEIELEISSYINLLDEKIQQLTTLRKKLTKLSKNLEIDENCEKNNYCCNVLHQLSTLEKGGEK